MEERHIPSALAQFDKDRMNRWLYQLNNDEAGMRLTDLPLITNDDCCNPMPNIIDKGSPDNEFILMNPKAIVRFTHLDVRGRGYDDDWHSDGEYAWVVETNPTD